MVVASAKIGPIFVQDEKRSGRWKWRRSVERGWREFLWMRMDDDSRLHASVSPNQSRRYCTLTMI